MTWTSFIHTDMMTLFCLPHSDYFFIFVWNNVSFIFCYRPLDKDNASQSSTDTAMSSESPNQTAVQVKQEVPDAVPENGAADLSQPDVSPRKKPRKQLLYVQMYRNM